MCIKQVDGGEGLFDIELLDTPVICIEMLVGHDRVALEEVADCYAFVALVW